METAELVLAGLVVLFGSGGAWAIWKIRSETVDTWASVAADLRDEVKQLDDELSLQRRRRHELEEEVQSLEHRVSKLEQWILKNTDTDPADINGPRGVPI